MTSPDPSTHATDRIWPAGLPRHLQLPEGSIWSNLERSAEQYPDKAAVIFYDHIVTYAVLFREAIQLAGYLQEHCQVVAGERVVIRLHNSPQFIIAYHAVLRANAVVVPLGPTVAGVELTRIIEDCGATALISDGSSGAGSSRPRCLRRIVVVRYADYLEDGTDLAIPTTLTQADAGARPSAPSSTDPPRAVSVDGALERSWREAVTSGALPRIGLPTPDDICVMPYTSGTTGTPKGCPHRHSNVMQTAVGLAAWHGRRADDVMLATLPLYHVTGMQNGMNTPIYLGATIVIMARWDPVTAMLLLRRHRVTCWSVVPTFLIDVLALPSVQADFSSLRMIGGGGAKMPASLTQELQARTGLHYVEGYGLTETMAPTHINPHGHSKESSLGIAIFDTDARIIDLETGEILGPNQTGEIVVCGPQVFDGYWNRDIDNRDCFITLGGRRFFRTGDLGYRDVDGYFFLVDRLKRMINVAGTKVWPADIETTLHGHPAIRDVAVVAAPDARRGEAVKALVVLRDDAEHRPTGAELIAWTCERMAHPKVPTQWEFVSDLPRSPTGKVLWRSLQAQQWPTVGGPLTPPPAVSPDAVPPRSRTHRPHRSTE